MKKTRLFALILAILITATVAAGCQNTPSGGGGGKDVELTWLFWDDLNTTQDLMSLQYAETLKRFNEADNGIKVTAVTTDLDGYDAKLNSLVAANQAPDVFICNPGPSLTQYVNAGVALDLTSYLQADSEWQNSFIGGIFERLTYDGKIMAVPLNFAAACVYYNTEIFEKVGVDVPKTWTEFMATCQAIQDAGYAPLTISAGTSWCLSMVAGYLCDRSGGAELLRGVNDGTISWTDPRLVGAANKLIELSAYFQPTYLGDNNDMATANFYRGEAAMLIQGSWAIGQINGNAPEMQDKCGVFQFPAIEGGADPNRWIVKTDNLVVAKQSKNIDASIKLLKEFTGTTAQKATGEIAGKMPIINVELDYNKAPKQMKYVQDCMKTLTGTLGFYNESFPTVEAGSTFDDYMVSIVTGENTPEVALGKIQQFFNDNIYKK